MNIDLWIVVIAGIGIGLVTIGIIRYLELRRFKAIREAGAALGLRPLEKGEPLALPSVALMRTRRRGVGMGLRGSWRGHPVLLFDLFHSAGTSVSRQTVLMVRFDDASVPEFAAIERNANRYLPSVDLNPVTDAPAAVTKHWLLYTRSGRWPFGERIGDWMRESHGRKGWFSSGWSIEGIGDALYVYRRGVLAKPGRLAAWLDEALAEASGFASRAETIPAEAAADCTIVGGGRDLLPFKASLRFTRHWTIRRR